MYTAFSYDVFLHKFQQSLAIIFSFTFIRFSFILRDAKYNSAIENFLRVSVNTAVGHRNNEWILKIISELSTNAERMKINLLLLSTPVHSKQYSYIVGVTGLTVI